MPRSPNWKAAGCKAPGYGACSPPTASAFLIGGAGGKGLVHDNKTKKNTSPGHGPGQRRRADRCRRRERRALIIFKTAADERLRRLTAAGGATAQAGADSKAGRRRPGRPALDNAETYTLTKNGLEAAAIAGWKFWKDGDIN